MQHIKYITLFTLLLSACGSNFTSSTDKFGPEPTPGNAGQAQETAGSAGQNAIAGNNSVGGADNAGGAGKENSAGSAGNNMVGTGGELISAGSSGMSAGGSNSAGVGNSSAGSAGSNSCIPSVTCDSYSKSNGKTEYPNYDGSSPNQLFKKSCGLIDDGCGNKLNCGGCDDGTCGTDNLNSTPKTGNLYYFTNASGDKNICNYGGDTGCVRLNAVALTGFTPSDCRDHFKAGYYPIPTDPATNMPVNTTIYYQEWVCLNSSTPTIPPENKCKNMNINTSLAGDASNSSGEIWCCSQ